MSKVQRKELWRVFLKNERKELLTTYIEKNKVKNKVNLYCTIDIAEILITVINILDEFELNVCIVDHSAERLLLQCFAGSEKILRSKVVYKKSHIYDENLYLNNSGVYDVELHYYMCTNNTYISCENNNGSNYLFLNADKRQAYRLLNHIRLKDKECLNTKVVLVNCVDNQEWFLSLLAVFDSFERFVISDIYELFVDRRDAYYFCEVRNAVESADMFKTSEQCRQVIKSLCAAAGLSEFSIYKIFNKKSIRYKNRMENSN